MATKKTGSLKGTDVILITSVNLAASDVTGVLPVANGGNGTGSFTDGQLLIGNTTGNTLTKTTLTGTANQVVVTNGAGAITLSLPQNIATTSPVTFASLACPTFTSAAAMGFTPASGSGFNVNLATTGDFAVNTNQLYVDTSLGNVGVGTTSPPHLMSLSSSAVTGTAISLYNTAASVNNRNWAIVQNNYAYADLHFTQSNSKDGNPVTAGTSRLVLDGSGNLCVGPVVGSALIHGIKTTEQLRLGYDASNYLSTTVSSAGLATLATTGTNASITLTPSGTGNVIMSKIPRFNGTNSTGAGSSLLGANSPATTLTAPYTWISIITSDGSTAYVPCWK